MEMKDSEKLSVSFDLAVVTLEKFLSGQQATKAGIRAACTVVQAYSHLRETERRIDETKARAEAAERVKEADLAGEAQTAKGGRRAFRRTS
jgi:hypothetical protein